MRAESPPEERRIRPGWQAGFGPVDRSGEDKVFHENWEASPFTMIRAAALAGAYGNADQFRHANERIDPRAYLTHGYYARWQGGIKNLFVEAGLLDSLENGSRYFSE